MPRIALVFILFVSLAACGEATDAPVDDSTPFALTMGVWSADDAVFAELADGQEVNVVMGFQGLVFANLALMAERDIPARFTAEGEIVFPDVDERYPFYDNQVLFEPLDESWRLVPSFRVPFGLPASELDGREVRLDLRFESRDGAWVSEASYVFTLTDEDCVHTPDGEFICGG